MKVRIKKLGGQTDNPFNVNKSQSTPSISTGGTLNSIPRDEANVEVEKDEFIVTNFMQDGIPETFKAGGQRHSSGGTPLNLPENSFVFSDTKSMIIKDKDILKEFNVSKSSTPAQIAKKYDISKYKEILINPDSDKREIETAEKMISNYNIKLGKLALVQESMKSFEDGIPKVAFPYLLAMGISPEMILPEQPAPEQEMTEGMEMAQRGGPRGSRNPGFGMRMQGAGRGFRNPYMFPYMSPPGMQTTNYTNTGLNPSYSGNYTQGIAPRKSTTTVKKQEIPKNAVIKTVDDPTLKQGDYIKRDNGTYAIFKGETEKQFSGKTADEAFDVLTNKINSLSPEAKAKWINAAKEEIKNSKAKGSQFNKRRDELLNLSDQDFIDSYLNNTKNVYEHIKKSEAGDVRSGKKQQEYDKGSEKYDDGVAIFQAMYRAGEKVKKENPDEFQDFTFKRLGASNEADGDISQVEGWWGDTTRGQGTIVPIKEKVFEDIPETEETVEDYQYDPSEPERFELAPDMWKQDQIRMADAAANYLGLEKYLPHMIPVDMPEIDPTFYDPSRALAAVGEQANIATQGLGPNNMAARMALQAQAAGQAANIAGEYDARNVGVANQFEAQNAQLQAQEAMMNNQKAEELYDQWVVTNQQYDNSQAAARTAMNQSYSDAITNMWQTDAFNKMYPQYAVMPGVGGATPFLGGKPIDTSRTPQKTQQEIFDELIAYKRDRSLSDKEFENYLEYMKDKKNKQA
jgi:hypothetical protein